MLTNILGVTLRVLFPLASVLILAYLAYNRYGHGINHFDGPFLASVSSLWRVWDVWRTSSEIPFRRLRQRYGPTVRLGPRRLVFSQPQAIRDIYGPHGLSQKSDMHLVVQRTARGVVVPTLLGSVDTAWHHRLKRSVNSAFAMFSTVQYEPGLRDTIETFLGELQSRFADQPGEGGVVNFPIWLHYFTDDAITKITYGDSIGHMRAGRDVNGILTAGYEAQLYSIMVFQMPVLDRLLRKNPLWLWLNRRGLFASTMSVRGAFAANAQEERRLFHKERSERTEESLTDNFIRAQEEHPDVIGPKEFLSLGLTIVAAGSETT